MIYYIGKSLDACLASIQLSCICTKVGDSETVASIFNIKIPLDAVILVKARLYTDYSEEPMASWQILMDIDTNT